MKNYRYDIIGADLDAGIKEHPQTQMKKLGYKIIKSEPVSIADCWIFRVESEIEDTPSYLIPISDDYRFSDEYKCPPSTSTNEYTYCGRNFKLF